jgi:RNA polymerase sigma factor (sigma-70 family)
VAAQVPPAAAAEIELTLSPSLSRALRRLNSGDRDALLLLAWGNLSYEQVAQALNIPIGTVRSRIARARAQVEHSLARLDASDPTPSTTARQSHA